MNDNGMRGSVRWNLVSLWKRFLIVLVLGSTLIIGASAMQNQVNANNEPKIFDFAYTGKQETFIVPESGLYTIETWGAQGGTPKTSPGGLGGYAGGDVYLTKGDELKITVGGDGDPASKGYNGGGRLHRGIFYGGGATDVRVSGSGLMNRIIVAGGGGAASNLVGGGFGGGLNGGDGLRSSSTNHVYYYGKGGTQSAGGLGNYEGVSGTFGKGGDSYIPGGFDLAGGGGSGWYGGSGSLSQINNENGAGGGSSYVFTKISYRPNLYSPDSKYEFTNAKILAGNEYMINKDNVRVIGNTGNGFARIKFYPSNLDANANLNSIKINNIEIPGFSPNKYEYNIPLSGEYSETDFISVGKNHTNQVVEGDGEYQHISGDQTHIIFVRSADTSVRKQYKINFVREKSTQLKSLNFSDYHFEGDGFKSNQFDYEINAFRYGKISHTYETYSDTAVVDVEGLDNLKYGENIVTVTVTNGTTPKTVYTIKINRIFSLDYEFTGKTEEFVAPYTGKYRFDLWGAQGYSNGSTAKGGNGGFTSGVVNLVKGELVILNVGGDGNEVGKGFNGGGKSKQANSFGGGATDIRISGNALTNRILVAAGGGSASRTVPGGFGGGLSGQAGIKGANSNDAYWGRPGTQTEGGSSSYAGSEGTLGQGGAGYLSGGWSLSAGGGGGWFGGGGSVSEVNNESSAGGGSSYILSDKSFKPNGMNPNRRYYPEKTEMLAGNESMFDVDGNRSIGREGHGHLRVTFVADEEKESANLEMIRYKGIDIPGFDEDKYEYTIMLDGEYSGRDELSVVKIHDDQVVSQNIYHEITYQDQSINISVVSADKKHNKEYKINFVRPATSKLYSLGVKNFLFEGEIEFDHQTLEYNVDTFRDDPIEIEYTTFDKNASVVITGLDNLVPNQNNVIKVTVSSTGVADTVYTINVNRKLALDYTFSGGAQTFIAPYTGSYLIETWGAQGYSKSAEYYGGRGGFASGNINLTEGELVYIYVGGEGNSVSKGFNGGGSGNTTGSYGGGASDIRIGGYAANNRVLVAGGGGGAGYQLIGGDAGTIGADGKGLSTHFGKGGTQITGGVGFAGAAANGTFGKGGDSYKGSYYESAGGGSGWFGGGGSISNTSSYLGSAGGGSNYVLTATSSRPNGINPPKKNFLSNGVSSIVGVPFYDVDGSIVDGRTGNGHVRVKFNSETAKKSTKLEMMYYNGNEVPNFKPDIFDYTIKIPGEYVSKDELSFSKQHNSQIVVADKNINLTNHDHTEIITVISADGKNSSEYTVTFEREKTTKLYDLNVDEYKYSFTTNFKYNHYSYDLASYVYGGIQVKADTFHKDAVVTVQGARENELRPGTNRITVTVSLPGVESTVYEINAYRMREMEFGLSESTEKFSAPYTGMYKLEAWGGQGFSYDSNTIGGKGGYATGELYLRKGELIYVTVGGSGETSGKGYNGGGLASNKTTFGGGASDIRLGGAGDLYRVLVAGGGGGSVLGVHGGAGGGLTGVDGAAGFGTLNPSNYGRGGTQTTGGNGFSGVDTNGKFGIGGSGYSGSYPLSPAGGGGWFGGGGGIANAAGSYALSAGGGSSYILDANSARRPDFVPATKYYLSNSETISGNESMPGKDGFSVIGNEGNGFVRISLLNLFGVDASLDYLNFSHETRNTEFDADTLEYDLVLDPDQTEVVISADTTDHNASVAWDSTKVHTISPGITRFELVVTAQDGSTRVYVVRVHRYPSTTSLLSDLSVNGQTIAGFSPSELNYELNLTHDESRNAEIDWTIARPGQKVTGQKTQVLENGVPIKIVVISEDTNHTSEYVITPIIEDSNLLKTLEIDEINFDFEPEVFEYDLTVSQGISSLKITAIPFDHEATVSMVGNGYLRNGMNEVIITVDEPNLPSQRYVLNVLRSDSGDGSVDTEYDFTYKGEVEYFEAPYTGNYELEVWGAEGGSRSTAGKGGKGGYSKGIVRLVQGEIVAVYVGGAGNNLQKGFNGGGISGTPNVYGGGASDIRIGSYSLNDRIIVAGGGGSVGSPSTHGGAGGGTSGTTGVGGYGAGSQPGTQKESGLRGSFGFGGAGLYQSGGRGGAGGGGWFGGGGVTPDYANDDDRAGAGGSAYVFTEDSHKPKGYNVNAKYYLSDTQTIAGHQQMPDKDGGYVTGNTGNGFVRITALRRASTDNNLERIELDGLGTLEPEFDTEVLDYVVNLGVDQTEITIKGVTMDPLATVVGNGTYIISESGEKVSLIVTAENGDIKTYTVQINRPASDLSNPQNIAITGLVPSLCGLADEYCKLTPEFSTLNSIEAGDGVYSMIVPARIRSIEFSVIKGHEFQKVIGEGVIELEPGDGNTVYIEVESEDGSSFSSYIFNIDRDMTGNADLDHIEIEYPERDIEYKPDVTEYYFSVPNEIDHTDKMDWSVVAMDPNANIITEGEGNLNLGNNQLSFTVVANNGLTKTYKLFIYREDNSNTFLKRMVVTHEGKALLISPSFNKVLHDYVLTVENDVNEVVIIAEADAPDTTEVINGVDGVHELRVGQNDIEITTRASDGSLGSYKISIYRKPSSNTMITKVLIDGEEVTDFNPALTMQTVLIDSQITKPKITVELEDEHASYTVSGSYLNFVKGPNPVHIRVHAEDGTQRNHTIIFDKQVSDDSTLATVTSTLFNITDRFESAVTEYEINIPYSEEQMIMGGTTTHKTSKVEGLGGYYLSSGLNIVKISVTAEDNTSTTYTFKINMLKNTDPELVELKTDYGVFDPAFNPMVTEYSLNVSNETKLINVQATPKVSSTVVTGLGEYILHTGLNEIKITAKAENGKTIVYTLNVTRDVSTNADLSYLVVHEGALSREFVPYVLEYNVKVPSGTRRLNIEAAVADPFATYSVINADNLKPGNNLVIVRVTPQDKVGVKDYILNVFVQEPASSNINLTNLKTKPGQLSPEFLPARQFYRVSVANEVTSINVDALAPAGVEIVGKGDHALKVGNNIVVITTKAANGVTKDYQIEVKRAPSSDARIRTLSAPGVRGSGFNPNAFSYEWETALTQINFGVTTMHENASYEILGNNDFTMHNKSVVIIRVTAEDKITKQDYLFNMTKIASRNTNLKSLSISGIHFTPEFSPSVRTYTAKATEDITQVVVTAIPDDINAKVTTEKVHTLNVGRNFIDVLVLSESKEERRYTVVIDKEGSRNRNLSALNVDGTSVPDFHKDKLLYEYTYEYEKESIFIDYELEDPKASITGVGEVNLKVGVNSLPIVVTSENGEVKDYVIKVTRKPINSAEIEILSIDQYPIDNGFDPAKENYNLVIDNEFTNLRFNLKLKDTSATFKIIGNSNLSIGNNTIQIMVTSSQGNREKTYTFNVFRQEFGNNTLAYLEVDKGTMKPLFFGGQMVYNIDLSYEHEEIKISGDTNEASALVSNLGMHQLKYGVNHIKIPVKANNGVVRTYHLMVNRSRSNDNYLNTLRVESGGKVFNYSPKFDPKVNEYTLSESLPAGTEFVNLIVSSNATDIKGHNQHAVVLGDKKLEIIVTSESGLTNTYVINAHRPASKNNNLVNIKPTSGGLAPNFIYTEDEYTLNVDTATTSLAFDVNTEDKNATVIGNERQIVDVGTSYRIITVTAENGDKKEYTIKVVKSDTNNAKLASLSIGDYEISPRFDHDVYSYNLVVPNNQRVLYASHIKYKTQDSNASVELTGTLNLLTGDVPNVYEIRVTAVDGFTTETYRVNVIRESNTEAVIEALRFSNGTLSKPFNSFVYEYDLEFGSETEKFNKNLIDRLKTSDPSSVVSFSHDNDIILEEGKVVPFTITVTSEDKLTSKDYVFNITYTRSKDNKLASVHLADAVFTPEFEPDVLEYDVSVHEDVTSIHLKAFPRDPKAKVLSVLGDSELVNHTTTIEIKVQAENGDIATYKLNVKRNLSESLDLKNISLTDAHGIQLNPKFDNVLTQYEAKVSRENTRVGIIVEKGHESQIVTLFDKFNNPVDMSKIELAVGRNQFRMQVKSPLGNERFINFMIMRDGNSNNYLQSLEVTDPTVDIEFNKDQMEYFIEVANSYDSIVVNAASEVESSKVEVLHNRAFKEGNNDVIVRVTAENGDVRNYVIHVFRAAKYNNFLQTITVAVDGHVISQDPKFFTPNFHRGTTSYVVKVKSTVTKVGVQGVPFVNETIVTGKSNSTISNLDNGIEMELLPGNNVVTLMSTEPTEGNVLIYTINIVREMSDDVSLNSLVAFENDDVLAFDEGEYTLERNFYTTNVGPNTKSIRVVASAVNPNARVTFSGNENLMNGENLVKVSVTSEDRTKTKMYTIVVNKNLSSDAKLATLNITHESNTPFDFDLTQDVHEYKVPKDVDTVTVGGTLSDPLADVNGFGTHSVIHGENKLKINVKAQNGTVKTYEINVTREFDNYLESLNVNQGELSPEFDPSRTFDNSRTEEYTVWVPLVVDRINLNGVAKNVPLAQVSGNGWHDLKIGSDNNFVISVQSSDGDTPSITRVKVIRSASPNTNLATLDLDQGLVSPTFDPTVFVYDTYIKDSNTKIDLVVIPEDERATYEIVDRPDAIISGSKVTIPNITEELTEIKIRVTAENGDQKDTILKVHRQPASLFSNLLNSLEVSPIKSMSPSFKPTTNNYIAIVNEDITFITIKATKQSSDATIVSGVGTFPVEPGRNTFNVVVRSKDGVDNIYKIIINQVVSADASLSNLMFDEGFLTPIFSRGRKDYSMNVGASTNFLTPKITPYANGTKWTVTGGGVSEDLKMGENNLVINTVAANGIGSDKYTVKVNKTNQTSVYLSELKSNIGTFDKPFDKFQEGPYRLEIGANVNSIILSGRAEEPQSVASIAGLGVIDMSQTNNKTVEVVVTGKAGNKMTYRVEIVKALNDDVKLSYLAVNPGTLDPIFSPNQSLYNVSVGANVDSIEILANTSGQATITGTGVKTLQSGSNVFNVTLTTDLGSIGVYTIVVEREAVTSAKILELRFDEALIETPIFDKDDFNYQLYVPYEVEELTINHLMLEDPTNSTYEFKQTKFSVGNNVVELVVTNSVSNEVETYKFNVTRYQFSSNFLAELYTDKGLLTPSFDKLHNNYEIDVKYEDTDIELIGRKEDGTASEVGLGVHKDLKVGVNEIKVVVTSATGVPRTYIIRINRLPASDKDLLTLNVIGGSLSPTFGDSEFNEYTVNVPENSNTVTFEGTIPDTATVQGLETLTITKPQTLHEIIVTAQDGTSKKYKFTIKKQLSGDAKVTNIVPTIEKLDPVFNEKTMEYKVIVQDEITEIGFDVTTNHAYSSVTGHETKQLHHGDNEFIIKSTSENRLQSVEYKVIVTRLKDIHSLTIDPENLVMNVKDQHKLDLTIGPVDASNTDVVWSSNNNDIVSVDTDGMITAHKVGSVVITVHSKKNPNIKATTVVEVLNLSIESADLEIVRDGLEASVIKDYVIGVEPNTSIDDYLDMFLNERSTLQVFDEAGTVITDLNTPVATKMTIRLIVNNDEYDVLTIIVRGDVNGDAQVDFNDQGILEDYIAFITTLDEIQEVSADVVRDDVVDFEDQSKIYEFIVYLIDSLN